MFRGPDDTVGHFASVQLGFVEAAQKIQERFIIFDGSYLWENSPANQLVKIASTQKSENIFNSLAKWLEELPQPEDVTIMVFEGSLSTIKEVEDLARTHPDRRFYINLFYPEPGLSIPGTYDHFVGEITDGTLDKLLKDVKKILEALPNIRLACDSDARSYLAQSLGLRIDSTWQGRSPVGYISRKYFESESITLKNDGKIEIFITVDIQRFTSLQFIRCIQVIRFVSLINKKQDSTIEWTFNFLPEEVSLMFRLLIRLMPRKRVKFVRSKVDLDLYAERIYNADLIWLPLSSYYVSSSSGRVADALVLRKPLLVPSGTYGQFEITRWIKNWPTYRSQIECAQIILNMQNLQEVAKQMLINQAEIIGEFYSNENQLKRVIGHEFTKSTGLSGLANNNCISRKEFAKNQISIFTFIRALAYSLTPSLYFRLVKLGIIGFGRKVRKLQIN